MGRRDRERDFFRSHGDPSPSAVGEQLQTIIPRAVYDYAAVVHERLESPRHAKLGQDVTAVLGSSDPPPGFGFLHPRFYYLEQKRPIPMEPLRVCAEDDCFFFHFLRLQTVFRSEREMKTKNQFSFK